MCHCYCLHIADVGVKAGVRFEPRTLPFTPPPKHSHCLDSSLPCSCSQQEACWLGVPGLLVPLLLLACSRRWMCFYGTCMQRCTWWLARLALVNDLTDDGDDEKCSSATFRGVKAASTNKETIQKQGNPPPWLNQRNQKLFAFSAKSP